MKDKFYYYLLIFMIGSFLGYVYEVIFYYFNLGFFNNWGILYGPYLPIYGIGSVLLINLKKYKKNFIIVFLCSIFITGLVEYIFGFAGLYMFGIRLWDYSGLFLNVGGFVCFRSVISFAVGSLFLIYFVEPFINKFYLKSSVKFLCYFLLFIFAFDIIFSFLYRSPYLF